MASLFNTGLLEESLKNIAESTKIDVNQAEETQIKKLELEKSRAFTMIKVQMKYAKLNRFEIEHQTRMDLVYKILYITCFWMMLVMILIFAIANGNLHLPDGILITIITTSSAQVLGFFYIVLRYMFNKNKST